MNNAENLLRNVLRLLETRGDLQRFYDKISGLQAWDEADLAAPGSAVDPERVAGQIYEGAHAEMKNVWGWDDGGLDDEHPGTRERFIGYAKSAMIALGFTIELDSYQNGVRNAEG